MISGSVNKDLLPMVPVKVKKLDGDWQELCVLLDTVSEFGFMLSETTASELGIAVRYDGDSPASIGPILRLGDSMPMPPHWVKLQLEGNSRVVEAKIIKTDDFAAVIGPSLVLNRRITIDVVRNGTVAIDQIPAPTLLDRIRSRILKQERQRPSFEYVWKLPWIDVAVRDSKGRWQCFSANVDTGNSEQLSLPPNKVEEFGLRLPGKCWVNAPDGPFHASCGEVEMFWQGSPCTVQCIQHQQGKPPLIGMKLLSGKRITIDFDYVSSCVEIARIPRSARNRQGPGEQGR